MIEFRIGDVATGNSKNLNSKMDMQITKNNIQNSTMKINLKNDEDEYNNLEENINDREYDNLKKGIEEKGDRNKDYKKLRSSMAVTPLRGIDNKLKDNKRD